MFNRAYIVYGAAAALIFGWWSIAFHVEPVASSTTQHPAIDLPISREELHQALAGDFPLITKLIAQWNSLPPAKAQRARELSALLSLPDHLKTELVSHFLPATLTDARGRVFDTTHPFTKILPQTYAAAGTALALLPPASIAALPQGFREDTILYPPSLTSPILLDAHRHNSEAIVKAGAQLAIVATYSDPAMVESLSQQGVRPFLLAAPNSLKEITQHTMVIGQLVNKPLEGELLALFIEAAINAMDTHLAILTKTPPRVLYLYHYTHFSTPSPATLTGELLTRLGLPSTHTATTGYSTPLTEEEITHLAPDMIILSVPRTDQDIFFMLTEGLRDVPAIANKRLYRVDDAIQQTPSHYIALAYYDLYQALVQDALHNPS